MPPGVGRPVRARRALQPAYAEDEACDALGLRVPSSEAAFGRATLDPSATSRSGERGIPLGPTIGRARLDPPGRSRVREGTLQVSRAVETLEKPDNDLSIAAPSAAGNSFGPSPAGLIPPMGQPCAKSRHRRATLAGQPPPSALSPTTAPGSGPGAATAAAAPGSAPPGPAPGPGCAATPHPAGRSGPRDTSPGAASARALQ